jgi:hypothetical protein
MSVIQSRTLLTNIFRTRLAHSRATFLPRTSLIPCLGAKCMSPAAIHTRLSPDLPQKSIKRRKLSSGQSFTTTAKMSTNSTILELTEVEENLRTLLIDVAKYIDNSPGHASESQVPLPDDLAKQPLVLRWTGGWVRDKLLGIESHDIDVAINKMTGFQFGLRLKEYLEIPGNPEKYQKRPNLERARSLVVCTRLKQTRKSPNIWKLSQQKSWVSISIWSICARRHIATTAGILRWSLAPPRRTLSDAMPL